MDEPQDEARRAGRGLLSIAGAKIYFIVAGFIVQFSLPRLFGSPEVFGFFSVAMSGISIVNNVLIAATIQSVSKFVSEDEARAPAMLRQGLVVQAALGAALVLGIGVGAVPIAEFMHDRSLATLLRIASIVTLSYAIYAALVGHMNGMHAFATQARFDATFTTLRTVGMLLGAFIGVRLGVGAIGAMSGFAAAAATIALLALASVGVGAKGARAPVTAWLGFMAPIWAYQGCMNGVLQVDLWVLKKTVAELATSAGSAAVVAAEVADRYAGLYRGAQTFAFVPYQLVLAMTFIVFPTVSRATALGDEAAATRAVRGSLRFSALALFGMAAPIAGAGEGVLRFVFGPEYGAAAPALRILAWGLVAFTRVVVSATAMGGSGRPVVSAGVAAVGLSVVVLACRVLLVRIGLGEHTLEAVATGTSLGMLAAMVLAALAVYRRFGTFVPLATAIRGALAAAAGYAVARYAIPSTTFVGLVAAPLLGFATYGVVLAVTRELGADEVALVRRVLGRGRGAADQPASRA